MVIGDILVWVAIALCLVAAVKPERTKRFLHFVGPPWGIRAFAVVALVLFVALPFVPMK
jgi:membrane protein YdbS with pleckstrin-like domain